VQVTAISSRESRALRTDDQGRYLVEDLPSGRYRVTASQAGYVTLSYGQRRPAEASRSIDVVAARPTDRIDLALPKSGAIVVRLHDEHGDPASRFEIRLLQYRLVNGERRLTPAGLSGPATTDDRGYRRLFGLPSGDFVVIAEMRLQPVTGSPTTYAPTFYPGTVDETEALPVHVGAGQEVTISFAVQPNRPLAHLGGVVRGSDGNPLSQATVALTRIGTVPASTRGGGVTQRATPDGRFSFSNVAPGQYLLTIGPGIAAEIVSYECASIPVTVGKDDINDLTVITESGGTIKGRFVFEGKPPEKAAPGSLTLTSVSPFGLDPIRGRSISKNDWTFEVVGLLLPRAFRVMGLPAGWRLKAITHDGRDMTDTPVEFTHDRNLEDVEVVLTEKRTELAGEVIDVRGAMVADYTVVMFHENRDLWTPQSRFVATARPNQQGQFSVAGLPPARYFIAALDYLEPGDEQDATVLARLQSSATRVTVTEGELKTISLRLHHP
jgi:hypothetical protein